MEDPASELRLFLQGVCCDYLLFHHLDQGTAPEAIRIRQEVALGDEMFADVEVRAGAAAPYFVEIKSGYSRERLLEHIRRKYGKPTVATEGATHVVVAVDAEALGDRTGLERELQDAVRPGLGLEIWDDGQIRRRLGERFGVALGGLGEDDLLELRRAVDHGKGIYAFGKDFRDDALETALLWHLAFWRVRRLRDAGRTLPRSILPPGRCTDVVVLMADLCSYSSYVRDTRDDTVSRRALTAFASMSRHRIINDGGMLYQFAGDSVVGLFGVPETTPDYLGQAFESARGLFDIGASVASHWQRHLDQIQPAAGVHVSMALGDLQLISLRPLSRTHMGVVGDSINLAARLNAVAGCDELVVSNTLYQRLSAGEQAEFQELAPVEAKNIGRIRAWKHGARRAAPGSGARGSSHDR